MSAERHSAATGVSFGRIEVASGTINPTAPASSQTPRKRMNHGDTLAIQAKRFAKRSIGRKSFALPAMPMCRSPHEGDS